MKLSRISLLILAIFSIQFFINCDEYVEQKCSVACSKFSECAEERFGKTIKITDVERSQLAIDCEKGCTREQSFILPCFETETSCKGLQACVLESGYMD
ncbi:MAG: Cys-rich protein [Leptospira sp.]|jgi:Cys-rich protein (TIGR04453 family)|nr:Cys-rich protein [Leptospira sp.]NCS92777.1 Cys-rich protein [Leptospira sp.]